MRNALPVICFEKAAGTAELLASIPETRSCVIPYLDIEAAVSQIQHLIDQPAERKQLGLYSQQLAERSFNLKNYVREIEEIALAQQHEKQREIEEREIIKASGLIDPAFFLSPTQADMWSNPSWWYSRAWTSLVNLRKPRPGFHPGIYAERTSVLDRDPSAHYIEAGQPSGPWQTPVIRAGKDEPASLAAGKAALHVHLYYPEMTADLVTRLKLNKSKVSLFITVPDDEYIEQAYADFKSCPQNDLKIVSVPNQGRDIGAFLSGFGNDAFSDYDLVGHLHTKMSHRLKNPRFVQQWSNFLLENIVGGKHPMMDTILAAMAADPKLGLVFADDPHVLPWGKNLAVAQELCQLLDLPPITKRHINFPVGTFFWARTEALQKLFKLKLGWDAYPAEPLPNDGTMLHALERLLPVLVEDAGFNIACTHVAGVTR